MGRRVFPLSTPPSPYPSSLPPLTHPPTITTNTHTLTHPHTIPFTPTELRQMGRRVFPLSPPPPLTLPLSLPLPTLPPSLLTHTQTHTHSPTHHPSHPNRATTNGWTSLPSVYLGAAPAGVTQRPCACRRERPSWTYT